MAGHFSIVIATVVSITRANCFGWSVSNPKTTCSEIDTTAAQIMGQFAKNLAAMQAQRGEAAAPATPASPQSSPAAAAPPTAKPISGFSLMAKVLWDAIARLFARTNR